MTTVERPPVPDQPGSASRRDDYVQWRQRLAARQEELRRLGEPEPEPQVDPRWSPEALFRATDDPPAPVAEPASDRDGTGPAGTGSVPTGARGAGRPGRPAPSRAGSPAPDPAPRSSRTGWRAPTGSPASPPVNALTRPRTEPRRTSAGSPNPGPAAPPTREARAEPAPVENPNPAAVEGLLRRVMGAPRPVAAPPVAATTAAAPPHGHRADAHPAGPTGVGAPRQPVSVADELRDLNRRRVDGELSEQEFARRKRELFLRRATQDRRPSAPSTGTLPG